MPVACSFFAFRRLIAATSVCIQRLSFKDTAAGILPHPNCDPVHRANLEEFTGCKWSDSLYHAGDQSE
jgi:hypothetical protein